MRSVEEISVAALIERAGVAFSLDLEAPKLLREGRATVVRARSSGGVAVGTLIIKQFKPIYRQHFLRERAGLGLLSCLPQLEGFVPKLLGDDEAALALLITDISEPDSYAKLIASGESDVAMRTCAETAGRLGVLHGHARSVVPEFLVKAPKHSTPGSLLRDSIPSTLAFLRRALSHQTSDAATDEFVLGSGLHLELGTVAKKVDEPSVLSTVTLGDMAPSNILLGPQGPVFIDLEYCAVRHAFYDAMFWHCIYPFSGDVTDRMDASYREGLRSAGVVMDDEQFLRTMFLFMSHRLFWTLGWNMETLFERDREVVPGVGTRVTLQRYLREYSRVAARLPGLEQTVLPRTAARLEERLSQIWPEEPGAEHGAPPC